MGDQLDKKHGKYISDWYFYGVPGSCAIGTICEMRNESSSSSAIPRIPNEATAARNPSISRMPMADQEYLGRPMNPDPQQEPQG